MKKKIAIIAVVVVFVVAAVLFFTKGSDEQGRVKINISASSLTKGDLDDLDEFAEKNGYISAKYNKKDGTVTVVLDDFDHQKMMYQLGKSVISNVYGMMNSDSPYYNCIKDIERNENFTEMRIDVDREVYESDGSYAAMIPLTGNSCIVYLSYTDMPREDQNCTVIVRDAVTKEIIAKELFTQDAYEQE